MNTAVGHRSDVGRNNVKSDAGPCCLAALVCPCILPAPYHCSCCCSPPPAPRSSSRLYSCSSCSFNDPLPPAFPPFTPPIPMPFIFPFPTPNPSSPCPCPLLPPPPIPHSSAPHAHSFTL
ncbi:unnamed protein product, partial [Closterium sp. NIES-53]